MTTKLRSDEDVNWDEYLEEDGSPSFTESLKRGLEDVGIGLCVSVLVVYVGLCMFAYADNKHLPVKWWQFPGLLIGSLVFVLGMVMFVGTLLFFPIVSIFMS
jgi:hypothetical protein